MFWKIFLFAFTFKRVFEVKVIFLILRGSSASKCVFRLFVFQELDSMIPDLRRWQSPNHSKWIGYYFWTKIAFDEFPGENRTNMLDFEITIRQNDLFWTPIYEADTFEMIFWKVWHCRFARVTHWKVQDFWKNNKKVFFSKKVQLFRLLRRIRWFPTVKFGDFWGSRHGRIFKIEHFRAKKRGP